MEKAKYKSWEEDARAGGGDDVWTVTSPLRLKRSPVSWLAGINLRIRESHATPEPCHAFEHDVTETRYGRETQTLTGTDPCARTGGLRCGAGPRATGHAGSSKMV